MKKIAKKKLIKQYKMKNIIGDYINKLKLKNTIIKKMST